MFHSKIPPCPGHPSSYTLYKTRKGYRWQAKRGTYTKVKINSALEANTRHMTIGTRLASAIVTVLAYFISDFNRDGLQGDITGRLMRELNSGKGLRLKSLVGTELNFNYPLASLLIPRPVVTSKLSPRKLRITIKLPDMQPAVKVHNRLFTGYRFIAVLVYGDLQSKEVQQLSTCSPTYTGEEPEQDCVLELDYSHLSGNYLLCLRVESFEGNELAAHYKTRAMQILAAGSLHAQSRQTSPINFFL